MDTKLQLGDILDFAYLQKLQDAFAELAQITTVVIDPQGRFLTRPCNPFCAKIQSSEKGAQSCLEVKQRLCAENRRVGGLCRMKCPHSGLEAAALPIFLEGEHLGSWIISQALVEEPEPGLMEKTAASFGMDAAELRQLAADPPPIEEERFKRILSFLQVMTDTVVHNGRVNHNLGKKNQELEALTRRHAATANMMRRFIDSSDVCMYIADFFDGEILLANQRYADFLGVKLEEIVGRKCWDVGGPGQGTFCDYCPREELVDAEGKPTEPYVWENYNPNPGFQKWLRITNQAIEWVDGRLAHMVTFMDVTDQRKLREELAQLAYYDQQMALPNSLKLIKTLEETANTTNCILVCYDIQALRQVNDAYGRPAGDSLLKTAADWVVAQNFGNDGIYRLGGDEFCLFFRQGGVEKAMAAAQAINQRFGEAWRLMLHGQGLHVLSGASVAVVYTGFVRHQPGDILTRVERALEASRQGDKIAVYDDAMDKKYAERVLMATSLRECVKNEMQGFSVHFQPIVDPATGTWKGLESLCRWTSPHTGKPVPPLVFIKEAEQLGLIRSIGMFVLEQAVRQAKAFRLDEVENFYISVNLSSTQVLDERFVEKVTGVLKKNDFPGKCLVLEVTESTEFTFNEYALEAINNLRFRGVRFALDDFGTGYSSFNNLKNLPVSILKTERAFIQNLENDNYMQYFIYSMCELAHAADMKLVAEGVETREQLEILLKNGADYLQGYFFAKPMPAEELAQNLDRFVRVDPAFYKVQGLMNTEQIFSGNEAWLSSPKLFKLMNHGMQTLLFQPDMDMAINQVLEQVGGYLGVVRAYAYLEQPDGSYKNTHEWCLEDHVPARAHKPVLTPGDISPGWSGRLLEEGMIVAGDVGRLEPEIAQALAGRGIKAIAVLPMLDDGELAGFVGFDSDRHREWLPEEVTLMRNLCMVMANSMKKERLQLEVLENDLRFTDVLNNMGLGVMLTEPATGEILWANEAQRALYQVKGDPVGQSCYQVMHGRAERCDFCSVGTLVANPHIKQCSEEYYNEKTARWLMVNDSLVQWERGRKVHLQYSVDITEVKQAQQKLEHFASIDSMTGALNRGSVIRALRAMLREAQQAAQPMSLVFIDVDKLKFANDTFGHSFGDEIIRETVKAVRAGIRSSDLIGRYGGDEFVVLMQSCPAQLAVQRMEQARGLMAGEKYGPLGETFSFSYGVVDSTELPWQDSERLVNAVINLADDRMRDYKKAARAQKGESGQFPPKGR